MSNKPLNHINRADPLVEVVLERISEAIISGDLAPGTKLVETRLGEQLGVSRGPIREAIRRLEQMGVVEKIPYRGAFIAKLTRTDVEELHSVRGSLEELAVRLIIERENAQAIKDLRVIIAAMRQASGENNKHQMIELDADFHDKLIEHSNHKLLQELWVTIRLRLRSFLLLKTKRLYHSLTEAADILETIVKSIESGDVNEAMSAIRYHIDEARKHSLIGWTPEEDNNID